MDMLKLNKFVTGVVLAGVIALFSGFSADAVYSPEKEAKRGLQVQVAEKAPVTDLRSIIKGVEVATADTKKAPPAEAKIDIAAILATGDAAKGAKIAKKKCASCHTFDKGGKNKIGPNLFGTVGKAKAQNEGFKYSKAIKKFGGDWDNESLYKFLNKPKKFMKGTKMSFAGLKKDKDIANVISYLKQQSE